MKIPSQDQESPEDQQLDLPHNIDPDGPEDVGEHIGNLGNGNGHFANNGVVIQPQAQHVGQTQMEEAMFGAIDQLCNSTEQSYEQFLQCFTHFKPGEHVGDLSHTISGPSIPPVSTVAMTSTQSGFGVNVDGIEDLETQPSTSQTLDKHVFVEDTIDEEILGAATMIPENDQLKGTQRKPIVKMDNFVDDEGVLSDNDDSMEDEPYIPSGYLPSCGMSIDNRDAEESGIVPEETMSLDPPNDQIYESADPEGEIHSADPDAESHEVISQCFPISTALQTDVNFDSAGEPIIIKEDLEGTESDSDHDDLKYDPEQDLPNPGEVIDSGSNTLYPTNEEVLNVRQMDYSAKIADIHEMIDDSNGDVNEVTSIGNSHSDVLIDQVEPFSLDENFDYDNVTLTPKFSESEMNMIFAAMRKTEI